MIKAEIIADSLSGTGQRLTTMVVTFPRIILSELNTHRKFSKNSASSRAIPFEKIVKSVQDNPFIPIAWQKAHKGMQGTEYITESPDWLLCVDDWLFACDQAVESAKILHGLGVTKQLSNRLLEPFMWHKAIITASDFENFFKLRCPQYQMETSYGTSFFRSKAQFLSNVGLPSEPEDYKDLTDIEWLKINKGQAEIHIMALAEDMYDAYRKSIPKKLEKGDWHIPYKENIDFVGKGLEIDGLLGNPPYSTTIGEFYGLQVKLSVAKCARISYTTVDQEDRIDNYKADLKLHDTLLESKHASPFEHCAMCMDDNEEYRNFTGFKQYRQLLDI